jgi:tetratricopeptide (TPR) repeat protein
MRTAYLIARRSYAKAATSASFQARRQVARAASTGSVSVRRIAIQLLFAALLFAQDALGDPSIARQDEARSLAEEAFATRREADRLQDGWGAVYDRGIALAKQAIALDPALADAYFAVFLNMGRKAERSGVGSQMATLSELKRLLDRTLELDPSHAQAWEAKGEMLLRLPRLMGGSTSDGERALRRSAELAPQWAKPHLRLAELDWKNGRADEARAEALRARDLARAAGDQDYLRDAEALLRQMGVQSP